MSETFAGDGNNSFYYPWLELENLVVRHSGELSFAPTTFPVSIGNESIAVATSDERVYILSPNNGRFYWDTGARVSAPLAAHLGFIYWVDDNGSVKVANEDGIHELCSLQGGPYGALKWNSDYSKLYCYSGQTVAIVDVLTGRSDVVPIVATKDRTGPAISSDGMICCNGIGKVATFDTQRKCLWEARTSHPINVGPLLIGNCVIYASIMGLVSIRKLDSGLLISEFEIDGPLSSPPSRIDSQTFCFVSVNGGLQICSIVDRVRISIRTVSGPVLSSAIVDACGNIVVTAYNGTISVFSHSLSRLMHYSLNGHGFLYPAVTELGWLFFISRDGVYHWARSVG